MIIRSQDKKGIVNFNNIDSMWFVGGQIQYFNGAENSKGVLAEYSSKEKAIKVLDMICEQYQYTQECKCGGIGLYKPEFVFQMPEDSEVSVE